MEAGLPPASLGSQAHATAAIFTPEPRLGQARTGYINRIPATSDALLSKQATSSLPTASVALHTNWYIGQMAELARLGMSLLDPIRLPISYDARAFLLVTEPPSDDAC